MKSVATKKGIKNYLTSPFDVEVFSTLKSSNLTAKERIKESGKSEFVIVAREQTGGRGRFERRFFSPKDCGAYFSAVVAPKENQIPFITPICALATANAIREICEKDAKIKWVNDVYVEDKKCAGILCEAVASEKSSVIDRIVIGIGINLVEPKGGFEESIKDKVCAVGEGVCDVANRLIAKTIDNICAYLENFDKAAIAKEYKESSMLVGKNIVVCRVGKNDENAIVKDIDDECRLVVEYSGGGIERLDGGEVSVRW